MFLPLSVRLSVSLFARSLKKLRTNFDKILDPEGRSQKATLVVVVLLVVGFTSVIGSKNA